MFLQMSRLQLMLHQSWEEWLLYLWHLDQSMYHQHSLWILYLRSNKTCCSVIIGNNKLTILCKNDCLTSCCDNCWCHSNNRLTINVDWRNFRWLRGLTCICICISFWLRKNSIICRNAGICKKVTGRNAPRVRVSKSKLLCIEYRDFLEAIKIFLFHLSVNLYSVIKRNREAF